MLNTTHWLIALTVGLVSLIIYVLIKLSEMNKKIYVAGVFATMTLLEPTKAYTETDIEEMRKFLLNSKDSFANSALISSKKIAAKTF